MNRITVVIPALNEEKAIGKVLREIPVKALTDMGYETEILVIDNGSKDSTATLARKSGATVIIQPIRGYGNAYKAGFANATGDIIATGDADLTYPFGELPRLIKIMEKEDLDFISTNRLEHANPDAMTPSHVFGNKVLSKLTEVLFDFPFADSQSGMWIFRRSVWEALNVRSSGMSFSEELKIEAYLHGFRCAEVPINYRPRVGEAKLNIVKDGAKVAFEIILKRLSTFSLKRQKKVLPRTDDYPTQGTHGDARSLHPSPQSAPEEGTRAERRPAVAGRAEGEE
jgi:glycosyltransferase involved in cell wall biosynthesis